LRRSQARSWPAVPPTLVLALGLAFGLPACLVTNESFQPIDERIRLEGRSAEHAFDVPTGEPVFLEYGLIIRTAGESRPTVRIDLNGSRATAVAGDRLFATNGGKVLLPVALVRPGRNVLRVEIEGDSGASFELGGRIQNYFGIAPDFPRVFVVADEAVRHVNRVRPIAFRAFRFVVFLLVGWSTALALTARRFDDERVEIGRLLFVASPSVLPWIVLAYSVLTPRHVWLSSEALAVAAVTGWIAAIAVRWMGRHRVRVLQVAAVTLVTLAISEASLRLFHFVRPSFIFYSDPAGRYRGQPGAPHYGSRLNSRGFNDAEHTPVRPASVARRVVALGDSFAMGSVPYSANYLTLLESEMAADGSVEVINMGVSGTDPVDYLSMLVQEGLSFGPDLVLVNFFVGNDFESRERKAYEYSYVATLVNALWQLSRARPPAGATAEGPMVQYRDDEPGMTPNRFLEIEVDRSWVYIVGSDRLSTATARVVQHLRGIRETTRRAGAEMVMVVIPDEVQVNGELRAEVVRASGHAPDELDFELPNRAISAALANDGIPRLDLLPVFREESRNVRLYKPQDTHWNVAGNKLAAREIAAFLRETTNGSRKVSP
jgi:hypothetical protein